VIQLQQTAAVPRFFKAHTLENFGTGGEVLPEFLGEVGVHAFVFFFQGDS